jgi:hypothetical protein
VVLHDQLRALARRLVAPGRAGRVGGGARGQVARLARGRVDHLALGRAVDDAVAGGELGDRALQRHVLLLERALRLYRAADARVQAQQRDLHRHDPAQEDPDQPDAAATAQDAVDDAVVGDPADALEGARPAARNRPGRGQATRGAGDPAGVDRCGAGAYCCVLGHV